MALRLILGESGQGKTYKMIEEVIQASLKHPEQKYYVIAPEQFGLEMQKMMLDHHPNHVYSNIDVLSFYRLAYLVFEECHYKPKDILEDLGVSMVLKKILTQHENEFLFFKKSMKYPGFLDELKSMLMEFISYEVGPKDLLSFDDSKGERPGLRHKCLELGKIYQYFIEETEEKYMVTEQILDVVKEMVTESSILKEGIFYFDGFTGFTPVQLSFLKRLLPVAKMIHVTVTIPYIPGGNRNIPKEELFMFSEKTIYSLMDLCRESGVEVETPWLLAEDNAKRYEGSPELSHLQKNIFRERKEKYDKELTNIHAVNCKNPEEEAEYVMHRIVQLVREKSYRYRDFAILMGNETEYVSALGRKAQQLSIPIFEDSSQKMSYHSGVETLRALFHLAAMDYSYESVFRYLKSGMSGISNEQTDLLENYVLAAGIRGLSMWGKPFARKLAHAEEKTIELLEELRQRLLDETKTFCLLMKDRDKTVKEKMTVLYETMCSLKFQETFQKKAMEAEKKGEYVEAREYRQFFELLLQLLDKMVTIFGEETMSLKEISEIMDAGLETLELTSAPLAMDQVTIGDLKRTRLTDIKVLFFVGMNDGDMPPVLEDKGILCDDEKRILEEQGIVLSLNLTQRILEDEFYMYLAFTKPEKELYLCCSNSGADGKGKRPSTLFLSLQNIYPKLEVKKYDEEDENDFYSNKEDSKEYLIRMLRDYSENKSEVIQKKKFLALLKYWEEYEAEELRQMFEKIEQGVFWKPLSKEVVKELYKTELEGSVTRLERFAACPYQYYCIYGLELEEREIYQIKPMDIGNIFHKALEYYARKLKKQGYHWKNVTDDVKETLINEAVEQVLEDNVKDVLESSKRNLYKKKMVTRILKRTVEVLSYHLRNSEFEPDHFEMKFGKENDIGALQIPLSDGIKMNLKGVIDRVDVCEEDDRLLIKIIDYKSGNTQFDISDLYNGIQMQLVVYMNAALEKYANDKNLNADLKKVEPAGLFYYNMKDPIQNEEEANGEKKYKAFRMSGFANNAPDILQKLENIPGDKQSFTLRMTKNGNPYKNSAVMESDDFYRVGDYVRSSMKEMGRRIYEGEIEASPYRTKDKTACDYCPYKSVCGFEEDVKGYHYRNFPKMSMEEVLKKIREEVD